MKVSTAIKILNTLFNFFDNVIYNRLERFDSELERLKAKREALLLQQDEIDRAYELALEQLLED